MTNVLPLSKEKIVLKAGDLNNQKLISAFLNLTECKALPISTKLKLNKIRQHMTELSQSVNEEYIKTLDTEVTWIEATEGKEKAPADMAQFLKVQSDFLNKQYPIPFTKIHAHNLAAAFADMSGPDIALLEIFMSDLNELEEGD